METVSVKNPKDEKIVNKDDSVTNRDGNSTIEKDIRSGNENQPVKEEKLTELSDNDSPGILADENASNKGQGPAGENL